jgi:predicted DNA-binding transcriptional regulator YafY
MKSPKLQRWIDLLAALLARRFPVTLEDLTREVPAYGKGQAKEALRRMFERDKDELRAFGVRIETVTLPDGDTAGYRLSPRDFYLPYLTLMHEGRPGRPHKLDRDGYRGLPTVTFEPDELAAVADAGARVRELGDPILAEHAESALRKLAADLTLDITQPGVARVAPGRPAADPRVFDVLGHALEHRKRASFDYHSMGTDQTARRTVEPFGLFFLNQHWYLAARPEGEETVKNYRLSRIGGAEENPKRPGTPDYEIPATFRLREHARSRQAWELGDGDAMEATVELRRWEGAALAAARLGEPVPDRPDRRRFLLRRRDAFARWLLSFGGDLVPVAPPELVDEYRELARRTLAVYEGTPA